MQIKVVEFTIEGRKEPLQKIREKMLQKHKIYMRNNPDQYYNKLSEKETKEATGIG